MVICFDLHVVMSLFVFLVKSLSSSGGGRSDSNGGHSEWCTHCCCFVISPR